MPNMTPIRVRGKRGATNAEKWHAGKQRKALRDGSHTPSQTSSSSQSARSDSKSRSRRGRRRHDIELSKLEELPSEILHVIFEYSANVDLPLASPRLASQLASPHLYHELTSQILATVLGQAHAATGKCELAEAMRLMNSKFFTWPFFRGWLHEEFERLDLLSEWQDVGYRGESQSMQDQLQAEWTWSKMQPPPGLLPPRKLLLGPFTQDKVRFLEFVTSYFRGDPEDIDAIYADLAREGLEQAIAEGAGDTLRSFWTLGMRPDTELLRKAVIDSGCEQGVVRRLVNRVTHLASGPVEVDFLDPALWSFADKARMRGDEKGPWLMDLLKGAARDSGRKDIDVQRVKEEAAAE